MVDGEQLDVQPGTFDAVISRVGFSRYETAGGFEGPCELLVAAGTAPA